MIIMETKLLDELPKKKKKHVHNEKSNYSANVRIV